MVKINNKFGDIKIGTQGRAVYQRKHGQQIRRMREPKRAIPSETQIRHRQLYRAALDWRKTLSLANRRSLDGYAIANWIVDDHKIPLPWHRFALKLYLEHVHFTLLSKPTAPETGPWQKFESYETGDTTVSLLHTNYRQGQTFTPQETHTIDRIDALLYRAGNPGAPGHIILTNLDVDHKPTGPPLCDVTFTPGDIPLSPATWITFPIPNIKVTAGIEYGYYLYVGTGSSTNCLWIRVDTTGNYPRGIVLYSNDAGATWTPNPSFDIMFKEYGTLAGAPGQSGELEIRHPALKTITRKHEGAIDLKWENMSTLDDEMRLFNHLKLPADIGDLIEATTIADLTTKFQL